MTKQKTKILIIEDEFAIRETLKEALEGEGYEVAVSVNGREALDILKVGPKPQLILLDMMMPIMDGRSFLASVSHDVALAPIPVLVVSADANATNTIGAKAFVKKPPDLEILLAMVKRYSSGG